MNESNSRREELYNRYLKKKDETEKHKQIIEYFKYLKYDEQINEFPIETYNLLKETIAILSTYLQKFDEKSDEYKYIKLSIEDGTDILNTSSVL